jgi:hypothetical protein
MVYDKRNEFGGNYHMADNNWNDLGEQIRDAVDSAISSGNYTNLSRTIGDVVNNTIDSVKYNIKGSTQTNPNRNVYRSSSAQRNVTQNNPTTSNAPALYNRHPSGRIGSILSIAFGCILFIIGFLSLIGSLIFIAIGLPMIGETITFAVITAAGLWLGIHGIRKIGFLNRFDKYIRQLNQQMYIPLQNLAERNRKSLDYIKKDLQKMIDQRFFYEGHLDCENNYLILSDEAYSEYQAAKMDSYTRQKEMEQQQESQKLSAECQKLIDEGQAYVKHIRACNDVIPGVEISAKLDRMESLVSRIFDEVRIHPEVAPELQKMMDYYLPTTSKLLDSYRELDAQPISGENISSTKKEIEAAIDTLNIAFEKLLDSLFADRAWDISSDISVLNTMLAQEGLTQKDF